jgi:hypothetical protein
MTTKIRASTKQIVDHEVEVQITQMEVEGAPRVSITIHAVRGAGVVDHTVDLTPEEAREVATTLQHYAARATNQR